MTLISKHLKNVVLTFSQDEYLESTGRLTKKHKIRERIRYGVSASFGSGDKSENGERAILFGAGLMSQFNFGIFGIRPE